eukprot:GEMP01080655.1.p2 GENE.GEMP01080655.1~~GEMP01080655.1.p2  ORF type:complete len:111 (-),score=3.38 GEMP01080655.1:356-688(-)
MLDRPCSKTDRKSIPPFLGVAGCVEHLPSPPNYHCFFRASDAVVPLKYFRCQPCFVFFVHFKASCRNIFSKTHIPVLIIVIKRYISHYQHSTHKARQMVHFFFHMYNLSS